MVSKAKTDRTSNFEESWEKNPMRKPYLEKIVLNIGVGTSGEELDRAQIALETISEKKAVKTLSKVNVKEFNLRIGRPIGTKVTVRGKDAEKLLKKLLLVYNNKILKNSFDDYGNFGFGIKEHISIPGIEYDNTVGIWGLDVCGRIVRPGTSVKYKRNRIVKIPKHHYVSRLEAQEFLIKKFNVKIVKELELDII